MMEKMRALRDGGKMKEIAMEKSLTLNQLPPGMVSSHNLYHRGLNVSSFDIQLRIPPNRDVDLNRLYSENGTFG